jgi:GNAT superfamily N-acetyltransferase
MTEEGTEVTAEAAASLASLHLVSFRASVLAHMGRSTLERYYRWVGRSPHEQLFVARDDGGLIGAAVLSLRPGSLLRRFVAASPLRFAGEAAMAFVRDQAFRGDVRAFLFESGSDAGNGLPEVLQVFVAAAARGRHTGTALLQRVEDWLRARQLSSYCVRTLADDNAATLGFYSRRGFQRTGERRFCGERYLVLVKPIAES